MAVAVREISGSLADEERRKSVYRGDLLVFEEVGPMVELCALADDLIRFTLDTRDPARAQYEMDSDDYLSRVETLHKRFREHEDAKRMFLAALERAGVDLGRTFWDWLYLRVLSSGEGYASGRAAKLGFHRDTWSSNVYSQTNWWAPIYPITADRTLAFYPDYWSRPLKNTSGDWNLEEVRARRRAETYRARPGAGRAGGHRFGTAARDPARRPPLLLRVAPARERPERDGPRPILHRGTDG